MHLLATLIAAQCLAAASFDQTNYPSPERTPDFLSSKKTCTDSSGCSWESLGCDIRVEDEWLACGDRNIHGSIYINNIPETILHIALEKNFITDIDARTFNASLRHRLTTIDLENNRLGYSGQPFQLGSFPNMTELHLNNNALSTVDPQFVAGMPHLEVLYMHNNRLAKRPNLKGLDRLKKYLFDVCGVEGCTAVSLGCSKGDGYINCQNALIHGELNLNDDMSTVEFLYLHNNAITKLNLNMFREASNVQLLNLNNNQLQYVPSELFELMPKLRKLTLEGNSVFLNGANFECPKPLYRKKKQLGHTEFWMCDATKDVDL